ncbi:MAG: hypothetical protein IPJ65_29900 [Archangiaceae bacterium]|nr:hypothetical protein [Archangiaceae bacterium]
MIPRVSVAVNAGSFLLLAWLYGGDLLDAARARGSEVAAMSQLPSVPFAALLVGLSLVGGGLTGFGVLRRRDRTWRGYRVMPIVLVVGLFVDLFLVSANKTPFSSASRVAAAIEVFEQKANALATPGAVISDSESLGALLAELGEVPYLAHGEPLGAWQLKILDGCTGPRLERGEAGAGTLLYCVSADRSQAWVTAVGLPLGERFGAPQVVTSGGEPIAGLVQKRAAQPPPPLGPEGGEGESGPMTIEGDAGNFGAEAP